MGTPSLGRGPGTRYSSQRSANIKFSFAEFTFDTETGSLARKNRDLYVPEQTARLLAMLLERANQLVTRDELRHTLWTNSEFLDYDQGINTAVNRLRSVLHENPRNPQYIKTIPKRGYIFHGKVSIIPTNGNHAGLSSSEPVKDSSHLEDSEDSQMLLPRLQESAKGESTSTVLEAPIEASIEAPIPERKIADLPEELPLTLSSEVRSLSIFQPSWVMSSLAIVVLLFAGWFIRAWFTRVSAHALSLGVAPIQAQGGAAVDEIGESFRLSLIDSISQVPGVQVRAANAFVNTKQADLNIPNLSRSLGLDDLLLGSVVAAGNAYDWKFELIRAPDAIHLASFEYSGTKTEIPAIRDRLQHDLFHYLEARGSAVQSVKGSTNDAQAYEFYLQGTYHTFERSQDSLKQAIKEYHEALARDPKFALAYAGLATVSLKLSTYPTDSSKSLGLQSQEFARQALRLNPTLAQAHAVLGFSAFSQDWDFVQGERELRYAISLDPTQADYRDWLCVLLTDQGRFDEALQQIDLAHATDPNWPSVYGMEAIMASQAQRPSRAIAAGKKYVEMLSNLPVAHDTLAWTYFNVGEYKNAIDEWREMALLQNDQARVQLEDKGLDALKKGGIRAYAQLHLEAIKSQQGTTQKNDFVAADWDVCAGKYDEALAELEKSVSSHDRYSLALGVNPIYSSLRHDPRFLKLLSTVGVSPPASLEESKLHVCEMDSH